MKTKLQQADELITRLATVILNEKIADHIPYGLVDEVKAWLRAVHTTDSVHLIVGVDHGDGHYRLDTGAVLGYARRVVAQEDLNRYLFKTGYAILELPIVDRPQILPSSREQQEAWEVRERVGYPYDRSAESWLGGAILHLLDEGVEAYSKYPVREATDILEHAIEQTRKEK